MRQRVKLVPVVPASQWNASFDWILALLRIQLPANVPWTAVGYDMDDVPKPCKYKTQMKLTGFGSARTGHCHLVRSESVIGSVSVCLLLSFLSFFQIK